MRFPPYPNTAQEVLLAEQRGHTRYMWNLGLEQALMWRRWQGPTPGFNAPAAQLTPARAAAPWLACASHTVKQQGLRDLDQEVGELLRRRPRWRRAGQDEGLRIVRPQASRVGRDNRAFQCAGLRRLDGFVSDAAAHRPGESRTASAAERPETGRMSTSSPQAFAFVMCLVA
jgi:hypothetical protein